MALLRRAGSEFERRLTSVTPDQLSRPSPCEEWTVSDLISHVVGESIMSVRLLHRADAEETVFGLDGDTSGADAPAAFATTASAEYSAFKESGAMEPARHRVKSEVVRRPSRLSRLLRCSDPAVLPGDIQRARRDSNPQPSDP
jgi:uncharacterized protein (TIGR03086 family)